MNRDWFKLSVYFQLAAIQSLILSGVLPKLWEAILSAYMAGLLAVKALDSNPNKKETK